jgi:glyoxylase-like metal-dependent hydrolase (beta-lactamase superfamily II)
LVLAFGLAVFATALFSLEIHDAVRAGDLAKVKALLDEDPHLIGVPDRDGMPPLVIACLESKGPDMVRLLVERGADVTFKIRYGGTLLDLTYDNGDRSIIPYLESKGARFSPVDLRLAAVGGSVSRITFGWGMLNNIAVLGGPDGLLIVDSGFSQRAWPDVQKALDGLHQGDLRIIVNSHAHGDHTAGNTLAGAGVKLIDAGVLRNPDPGLGLAPAPAPLKGASGKAFESGSVLRFDGEDVVFIPYPGLHSPADILTYFSGSRVVHMGDLLLSQCCPAVQDVAGYMAFLDMVVDCFPKDTTFISGHGRDLTMDGVKKYRADLAEMIAIVTRSFQEGKTAEDMLKADILKAYKPDYSFLDWLGPDSWLTRVCQALKSGRLK